MAATQQAMRLRLRADGGQARGQRAGFRLVPGLAIAVNASATSATRGRSPTARSRFMVGRWTAGPCWPPPAGTTRAAPSAPPGRRPRPGGPELGGVVARRRDAVFAARERAYRLYRARGTRPARPDGDVAGGGRARLPRRPAGATAGCGAPTGCSTPLEPGPDHGWLAFHEGYLAHAAGDTATARELAARGAALGRRLRGRRPGDARPGAGGRGAGGLRGGGCGPALPRRGDGDRAGGRARRSRSPAPGPAASWSPPAPPCSTSSGRRWCDRIAAFAERYGSRYMLAFCRAEYGAVRPVARALEGRRGDARGRGRGLPRLAPGVGRPRRWPRWPSCGAGRAAPRRRARCWTGPGRRRRRAVPRPPRPGGRRRAAAPWSSLERLLRRCPPDRRLERAPALELLVRARGARGELDEARLRSPTLREVAALAGTPALRARADLRGGRARGRARRRTSAPARCSRTPSTASSARRAVRGGAGAARARGHAWPRSAARDAGGRARRPPRARRLAALGAAARRRGADRRSRAHRRASARCCGLLAEGLTNRGDRQRLVLSEHTVHRHVDEPAAQARPALADGRRRPRGPRGLLDGRRSRDRANARPARRRWPRPGDAGAPPRPSVPPWHDAAPYTAPPRGRSATTTPSPPR